MPWAQGCVSLRDMLEAVRRRFDLGMLVMYILHFFFGFGFLLGFHWLLLAVIIQSDYRDFCKIVERLGDRELHLEFSDVSQDEFPIEEQRQVIRDLKHYRVIALINCFSYHLMNIVYWSMHLALSLRLYACPTQFGIAPTCVENASGGIRFLYVMYRMLQVAIILRWILDLAIVWRWECWLRDTRERFAPLNEVAQALAVIEEEADRPLETMNHNHVALSQWKGQSNGSEGSDVEGDAGEEDYDEAGDEDVMLLQRTF